MRALILAAGRGERLRPVTDTTPKPLLEIAGQSLIARHLERLSLAGFREVTINLAHLGEMIQDALGDGSNWGLNINYSLEPPGALDSGGGIFQALPTLGNAPFAVINADIYTAYPLTRLRAIKCDNAHLVLVPNPQQNPNGDFGLQNGLVNSSGQRDFTFSGISVYHPRFFKPCESGRFSVVPMLRAQAENNFVTGEVFRGDWHDIGNLERLENLQKREASGE